MLGPDGASKPDEMCLPHPVGEVCPKGRRVAAECRTSRADALTCHGTRRREAFCWHWVSRVRQQGSGRPKTCPGQFGSACNGDHDVPVLDDLAVGDAKQVVEHKRLAAELALGTQVREVAVGRDLTDAIWALGRGDKTRPRSWCPPDLWVRRTELLKPSVMESQLLEARVLAIVDAVLAGRQVEDDRVELKSTWPIAAHKTARQVAGHANAAGGEPILWIIGLDEKARTFGGTSGTEPADWWSSVRKHFVEVVPELKVLRVPVGTGSDVMVLQFTSDRAPYVVSVEGGGRVEREVPWREGNSTRTAHRHEMIRSIVAEESVPTLELIGGVVEVLEFVGSGEYETHESAKVGDFKVQVALHMFVSARAFAYLPEHRQSLSLEAAGVRVDLEQFRLKGSYRFDGVAQSGIRRRVPFGNVSVLGDSGVEVNGPGELSLRGEQMLGSADGQTLTDVDDVDLALGLPVDRSDRSARLAAGLSRVPDSRFSEQDIPDITEAWHLRRRFATGPIPYWWA